MLDDRQKKELERLRSKGGELSVTEVATKAMLEVRERGSSSNRPLAGIKAAEEAIRATAS